MWREMWTHFISAWQEYDGKTEAENPNTIPGCFINNYFLTLSVTDMSSKEKKKSYDKYMPLLGLANGHAKCPLYGPDAPNFSINR